MLRVETDSKDLSSEIDGFLDGEMVEGIVSEGDCCGGGLVADHFLVVCCPRVDTESSSFPYAVE